MKVTDIAVPDQTPADCGVTGEIVRIFRDRTGDLKLGAAIEFPVSCSRPGDARMVGGALWTDAGALARARYLEAFLNRAEARYQVALWQSRCIRFGVRAISYHRPA